MCKVVWAGGLGMFQMHIQRHARLMWSTVGEPPHSTFVFEGAFMRTQLLTQLLHTRGLVVFCTHLPVYRLPARMCRSTTSSVTASRVADQYVTDPPLHPQHESPGLTYGNAQCTESGGGRSETDHMHVF